MRNRQIGHTMMVFFVVVAGNCLFFDQMHFDSHPEFLLMCLFVLLENRLCGWEAYKYKWINWPTLDSMLYFITDALGTQTFVNLSIFFYGYFRLNSKCMARNGVKSSALQFFCTEHGHDVCIRCSRHPVCLFLFFF